MAWPSTATATHSGISRYPPRSEQPASHRRQDEPDRPGAVGTAGSFADLWIRLAQCPQGHGHQRWLHRRGLELGQRRCPAEAYVPAALRPWVGATPLDYGVTLQDRATATSSPTCTPPTTAPSLCRSCAITASAAPTIFMPTRSRSSGHLMWGSGHVHVERQRLAAVRRVSLLHLRRQRRRSVLVVHEQPAAVVGAAHPEQRHRGFPA